MIIFCLITLAVLMVAESFTIARLHERIEDLEEQMREGKWWYE
jgi:hypothetical protein